jgi:hypothetical protein
VNASPHNPSNDPIFDAEMLTWLLSGRTRGGHRAFTNTLCVSSFCIPIEDLPASRQGHLFKRQRAFLLLGNKTTFDRPSTPYLPSLLRFSDDESQRSLISLPTFHHRRVSVSSCRAEPLKISRQPKAQRGCHFVKGPVGVIVRLFLKCRKAHQDSTKVTSLFRPSILLAARSVLDLLC